MLCQYCSLSIRARNTVCAGTFCGICSRQVFGFDFPFNRVPFDINNNIRCNTIVCELVDGGSLINETIISTTLSMTFHKNIYNKQPAPDASELLNLAESSISLTVPGLGSIDAKSIRLMSIGKNGHFPLECQFDDFLSVALPPGKDIQVLNGEIILNFGRKNHHLPLLVIACRKPVTNPLQPTGDGTYLYLWRKMEFFEFSAVIEVAATSADIILDPSREPTIEFIPRSIQPNESIEHGKFYGRFTPKTLNRENDCLVKLNQKPKKIVFEFRLPDSLIDSYKLRANENLEIDHPPIDYVMTLPVIGRPNPFEIKGSAHLRNKPCVIEATCDLVGQQDVYLGDDLRLQYSFAENEKHNKDDFIPDITITSVVLAPNNYDLTQIDQYRHDCFEIAIFDKENNLLDLGETATGEYRKDTEKNQQGSKGIAAGESDSLVTAIVTLRSSCLSVEEYKAKECAIIISYHSNDCIDQHKVIMVAFKPYGILTDPVSLDWGTCNSVATMRKRLAFGNNAKVETLPIGSNPADHVIPSKILFTDLKDPSNPCYKIDDLGGYGSDTRIITQFKPDFDNPNPRIYSDIFDPPRTAEYTFQDLAVLFIHKILSNIEYHLKKRISRFSCTFPTKWSNKASDMLNGALGEVAIRLAKGNGGLVTPEVIKPTVDEASACILATIGILSTNKKQKISPFSALAIDIGGGTTDTAIVEIKPSTNLSHAPSFKFLGFGGFRNFAGTDITKRMAAAICRRIIANKDLILTKDLKTDKSKSKPVVSQIWIPTSLLSPPPFVKQLQDSNTQFNQRIKEAERHNDALLYNFAEELKKIEWDEEQIAEEFKKIEGNEEQIKVSKFDEKLIKRLAEMLTGTMSGFAPSKNIKHNGLAILRSESNELDRFIDPKNLDPKNLDEAYTNWATKKILLSLNNLLCEKIDGFTGHYPELTIDQLLEGICQEARHLLQVHDHHARQINKNTDIPAKIDFIYFAGGTTKSKLIKSKIAKYLEKQGIYENIKCDQSIKSKDESEKDPVKTAKDDTDKLDPKVLVSHGLSWYLMRVCQHKDAPIQFAKGCLQFPIVITDQESDHELRIVAEIGKSTQEGLEFDIQLSGGILVEEGDREQTCPLSVLTWDILNGTPTMEIGYFDFSHNDDNKLSAMIRQRKNSETPVKGHVKYEKLESNFVMDITSDGLHRQIPLKQSNTFKDSISLLYLD